MVSLQSAVEARRPAAPQAQQWTILQPNGTIFKMDHLLVKVACKFDYLKFPFDSMTCDFVAETSTYNEAYVEVGWMPREKMHISSHFNYLSTHHVEKLEAVIETLRTFNGITLKLNVVCVYFRRAAMQYILQAFVPNGLTVFVAYFSFFVDPDQVAARVTLGISSLIAMVLQYGNVVKNIPKVGYFKSIDFWFLVCLSFIFSSLLEFAVLSYAKRYGKKRDLKGYLATVDKWSSRVYSLLFLLFTVTYFIVFAT